MMETIEMLRKRMFQSLIGRLKTEVVEYMTDCPLWFQSLIGRLKTRRRDRNRLKR